MLKTSRFEAISIYVVVEFGDSPLTHGECLEPEITWPRDQ